MAGIYLTENLINGKKYIGQTTKNDENYLGSGLLILKAIKKNGKKNFKRTMLKECISQKELNFWETYFIGFYNSLSPHGYNLGLGGNGVGKHSKKTRQKMRKASKGRPNWWLGKKHSEATKQRISKALKDKSHPNYNKNLSEETRKKLKKANKGKNNPNYGKRVSEETRKKMSEALMGKKNPMYGKHHSKETRGKISLKNKEKKSPFFGKRHTEEAKRKISEARRKIIRERKNV